MKPIQLNSKKLIFLLLALGVGLVSWVQTKKESDPYFEITRGLEIFAGILKEVNNNYVDPTDPNQIVRAGIDAMLESLDPYTNFFSTSEIEDVRIQQSEQTGNIGEEISYIDKKFIFTGLIPNKPAHKAGIRVGDEIIQIDNEVVKDKGFELEDIINLLSGQVNSVVTLKIKREGVPELLEFSMKREDSKGSNVPFYAMADSSNGYIYLKQFGQGAAEEVSKALNELMKKKPKMTGLILDLRDNPGGFLMDAVAICNLFIDKGKLIVETKGRNEAAKKAFQTMVNPVARDIKLAVLINEKSASASEIVSGVMQDLDRGVVIGRQSFGKGLVQNTYPLGYNSQIKLTTARYYTPSGRCIQKIDYSARKKDGSPVKISDSLQKIFKTTKGRMVKDASGITPDITISDPNLPGIVKALQEKRLIFDFATHYQAKHPQIAPLEEFQISEELFAEFKEFIKNRRFEYVPELYKKLEAAEKALEKEIYFDKIKNHFSYTKEIIKNEAYADIEKHKEAIKNQLWYEIVERYYFKSGKIKASFLKDEYVTTALKVLNDNVAYQKIFTTSEIK
ncbi:MAG: S41 family peptidase [Bacteroidia bacterium]|nr:S41 family peptidase [Bacteroidia bacterium]MDW8158520.1 S41 family peptidase [Bacteroidia bacterium]